MCKSKQKNSLNSYKEKIMDTIKFNELQKELIENNSTELKKTKTKKQIDKSIKYVYVKDNEGYVFKIPENELNDSYTVITEKDWADQSGETYYKATFSHGGARKGAGRKQLHRDISIRITLGEKDLINYIRKNSIEPTDVLKRLLT